MIMMEPQFAFASRDEFWRLQEDIKAMYAKQTDHGERLARLERRQQDDSRQKNIWGPSSPFSGILGNSANEGFNPAAEEFRSFDQEPPSGLISNLALDNDDEPRRGASRANSVRFDERAINHYGQSSRSSGEILPIRTGSGLGSHPMSERSLSHRSDGRGSSSGLSMRANSFGLEGSRFFGSTTSSPLHAVGPPPGLFILGPVPSIIRCWLTTNFSNDSLLYAAVCTGSHRSSISHSLITQLHLQDHIFEEQGTEWVKLPVYLPEGTVQTASSRSNSPAPQVPTLTVRFTTYHADPQDASIQIIIGSDVLRAHNGDVLFSQDKISIFDDDRNRIAIPLVRPESDNVYKHLTTRGGELAPDHLPGSAGKTLRQNVDGQTIQDPGIIGRPSQIAQEAISQSSPASSSPSHDPTARDTGDTLQDHSSEDNTAGVVSDSFYTTTRRTSEDRTTNEDSTLTTPTRSDTVSVWNSDWRRTSGANKPEASASNSMSGYAKAVRSGRGMKVLRPTKSMANSTRAASATTAVASGENPAPKLSDSTRSASQTSLVDTKAPSQASKPRSANPVGEASAFSWMSKPVPRRAATGTD